jgi:Uma2 family endonuclease
MSTGLSIPTGVLSPPEWKDLLADILPSQGTWTEEEFLVLTDHTNRLVEFTDGFLEVLPLPTDRHQAILLFLSLVFHPYVKGRGGKVRFAPLRLQVRPGKFREPDLLLLVAANDSRGQNRFWTGADLALEVVSPDKPERDLVQKRADYAEARVPEYWIVNPLTETITVLRFDGDAYVEAGQYGRGDRAASVLLGGFTVDVTAVFEPD